MLHLDRCLHANCHVYLAIHKLLNEKLAELPPILDSFITGYANTTSTLVGMDGQVGGSGEPRSAWRVYPPCKVKTAKWHQLELHITHKTATLMPNLTSQSGACADFIASGDGASQRSPQHSWMSDRTQKEATAKAAWVTFSTDS